MTVNKHDRDKLFPMSQHGTKVLGNDRQVLWLLGAETTFSWH